MKLGRRFEGWLRELMLAKRLRARYGTRFPNQAVLPESGMTLFINPRERRARKQILFDSLRGRVHRNARFWREALAVLQPDYCIDVGANYGECGLGVRYPRGVDVLVAEANPTLIAYLQKSRAGHPNRDQIEIEHALVGESDAAARPFYLNQVSSGRSTAVAGVACDGTFGAAIEVPVRAVDSLLAERNRAPERLLFKIDVEGFEPAVLAGMQATLAAADSALGYVELDTRFIAQAGFTLPYYDSLLAGLAIYALDQSKSMRMRRVASLERLARTSGEMLHTDIVLAKNIAAFPESWEVVEA